LGCSREQLKRFNELTDYCSYGSVSKAQLEGCKDHVTADVVDRYDTNAARYAKGQLDRCLGDAGPYCKSGGMKP
jgi:hypothetical protein